MDLSNNPFFAPANTDFIGRMVADYNAIRARIEAVADFMASEANGGADYYFIEALPKDRHSTYTPKMWDAAAAIAVINADMWDKALKATDVLSIMPAKRINDWHDQIRERKCPDFTDENVRATIGTLLDQRLTFFAERVDGIFRSLSGEHVTNRPEGFYKRMIINYFLDGFGTLDYRRVNIVHDLRCVIAKLLGNAEPKNDSSQAIVKALRWNFGEWHLIDGGTIKIKMYMKGTVHLEIHPDLAWQLNEVLAILHPRAIPASFRQKPTKPNKTWKPIQKILPYAVTFILSEMRQLSCYVIEERYGFGGTDKHVVAQAREVLKMLGGVKDGAKWQFEYDVWSVLQTVIATGTVPDAKSHQYYPTPESVAQRVAELAGVSGGETVLEPSAGQGALVDALEGAAHSVTMVELSELHCKILEAKARDFDRVVCADFLAWEQANTERFDVVTMNPPFSENRWKLHTQAAARCLRPSGRLIAVLPASAKGKDDLLPNMVCEWSDPIANEFEGTSVSVVILKAVFK